MLDMYIHPSALDFIEVRAFLPEGESHSTMFSHTDFIGAVEMLTHSPSEIICQADVQNEISKCG